MGSSSRLQGNIYVAEGIDNNCIRKITTDREVSTFAGSGELGFINGTGTEAQFKYPFGIAVDAQDNIYVADSENHCIRKITPDRVVSTFAGSDAPGLADGTGISAQFKYPYGIAIDANGNLYVAEGGSNRIRKITPDQVVSTFAGSKSGDPGSDNGTVAQSKFNSPYGITVDPQGIIYVADTGNQRIRKIE